ncbi:MAG: L-serine ammonia-lyase, iron-sulfur-dependent, subunit alpha [Lachnospiraceae bacterium]|nr:L-serine ammonia-lyase, iron-sulfur-dependent, subunit alpha [Lachnospiraceae bacterium]
MYESLKQLCIEEETKGIPFWQLVQMEDCKELQKTPEQSAREMMTIYQAMRASFEEYEDELQSASGLVGGAGAMIYRRRTEGALLCGDFIGCVMEKALKISESNACMKRIVAAPTAGSCGVVPAVFLSIQDQRNLSDEQMVEGLYVAGGIGGVIAARASLSGAAGGCQAEIGAASAMAAGGLVYLQGGNANDISNAAALALKSLLGLACDPVAGLVEVPCVKRNVLGAVNAVTAADMTLAGIVSRIPADEVFDAMHNIGKHMDEEIRETAKGGLATTPTGMQFSEKIAMC